MIIAIDFDGTCVRHEFPKIGADIGAVPVLKALIDNGHDLILYTMRGDSEQYGPNLTNAEKWFVDNGIKLYASQRNPTQDQWTSSPKCYAHLYIDDAALGIPLNQDIDKATRQQIGRPYVDWVRVREMLINRGVLNMNDNGGI